MRSGIIFLLILTITLSTFAQKQTVTSFHYKDVPFTEFSKDVQTRTGIKIWYLDEWVKNIKITLDADNISVTEAVREALRGTGLKVSEWNNDIILTQTEQLITTLPEYRQKATAIDNSDGQTELSDAEERYLTGRRSAVTETIRIGRSGGRITGPKARITGKVSDNETGEPLFNATIFIKELKTGGVTDLNGFFTILLKPGKYNAIIEILGYEKKNYLLEVLSDGEMKVSLNKAVIQMKEVVVYGDRQMNMKAKDPGLEKISMKAIKELPMMMGERDILKVSGMLPGIITTGEGSSGLNVRGGSSDQNAFYINKIPIYNTAHLFGFFPAFNSDIIKDFVIYKGHIPAQYGGRLSSVFNIITRQGNRKRITMHGGISPVTANIVLEGPIKKDTASVLLSYRSSYSDWILKKIKDASIRESSANFNDFSAGVNFGVAKTQIALFAYHSYDHFKLSDINEYDYTNNGASFSLSRIFSPILKSDFSIVASEYEFNTTDKQEVSSAYSHGYKMGHYEFRADLKHLLSDVHSLDYGLDFVYYKLSRGKVTPFGIESLRVPVDLGEEQGLESSVYISDSWDALPWLNITGGIRYTLFSALGPKTVYTYLPNSPIDTRYIADTLEFGNLKTIQNYSKPDFRIAVNIETDPMGSVKFAFNQMNQNLFMLNNTITVAPNTQWKLADYHLEPSRSNQVSAGVFRVFGKSGFDASVEAYYKLTDNYPEFKDGADFLQTPQTETTVLQGKQTAYGIEFFLKRSNRKLDGWVSYTYSKTSTIVNGVNDWEKINNGKEFPSNFDIPHSLNMVFNYHMTRRLTFSSIIAYQTGRPITYPVSIYYIEGVPYLDYSERNAYRIPDYFRTDISLTLEGNLRKQKLLHSSFIVSVYNLTGRENPYSVYFRNEKGRIKSYRYSVIGVPILTATWIFKLGNYASD
ncbi:MAG TPA: TonB-dependent receptor [Lentimicrobium sp.]|nr:TonB-dependent receptor [Lentimicrobium sp.]